MLLFKLILGVSIITLLVKIAKNKCFEKKQVSDFYYSLYILCEDFYGEMMYKKTPLEKFLKNCRGSELLERVIQSYLENNLNVSIFNKEFTSSEIDSIITFFSSLGDANTQSQKNSLLTYKELFLKRYKEKLELYNKSNSLYMKISFSIGLMAMVVVL